MADLDFSSRAKSGGAVLDFSARAKPGESASRKQGRQVAKAGPMGAVAGALATFNEAVPGLDELQAGLAAGIDLGWDFLTGKQHLDPKDLEGSLNRAKTKAWNDARERQVGLMTGFREDHPVASNLATGAGYAAQVAPLLMTGGATAAPALAPAAARGLGARVARVAASTARNAASGAGAAMLNAEAGRGSLRERGQASRNSAIPGAVAGVVAPAAVGAVSYAARKVGQAGGALGRTGVRAANAMAANGEGGAFLDPQAQVLGRLTEAMRKDGLSPEQINGALAEWKRVGGATPSFMDIIAREGGGQNTMALIRGAAMTGQGRNVASKYGARVAADLQDTAIDRTRLLSPEGRTVPQVEGDIEGRIAANSQAPQVEAGSGGMQVHRALNARHDAAKAAVDQAYDAVRQSDGMITAPTLTELPGRIRASLHDSMITPEVMPSLNPGTRAILGEIDRLSGAAGRADRAAQPIAAMSLESGIPTGGQGSSPQFPVAEIERVRKAINARLQGATGEDQIALQVAKREFDGWLGDAVDNGQIQGDAGAVDLLRNARSQYAAYRRLFGGEDLIQALTERGLHGAGRSNLVAPEDASAVLLGRGAGSVRPDMVRDLTRIRDTLGETSPEWAALRREATSRILGRDAGTENFGGAWQGFATQNPQLARLLMTPEEQAALAANRTNIAGAVADRGALNTGRQVLSTPSDRFAVSMTGVGERRPIAQTGSADELVGMIERPPEGATGVLNRIGSATRATNNLAATYGDQAAADYQAAIRNMVDQVNHARFINPNSGSHTAGRLADEALVESIPTSKAGVVRWIVDKFRSGATLTDQERAILVEMATGRAEEVAPQVLPSMTRTQPVRLPPRAPATPVAVGAMTGAQDRR